MRELTISAAALIVAATFFSAPASADMNYGPVQNASQCWTLSGGGSSTNGFGYWGACAHAASAPVAQRTRKHRNH